MAAPKFKLGTAVDRPAGWRPTVTHHDAKYDYRLDLRRRVVQRTPKSGDDDGGFFQLILPVTDETKPAKPELKTSLVRGIVVPTLLVGLLAGLFLVLYPLFPRLQFQVQSQLSGYSNSSAIAAVDPNHNRLVIPKIGVDTPIIEGPTLAVLNKHEGVWHQRGAIKGDNFVLAGHRFRYLPPNTTTFYNLDKLQAGDTAVVDWYGQRYTYTVVSNNRVDQHDVGILAPTDDTELTMYTCYDKRQTQRIVVVAKLAP